MLPHDHAHQLALAHARSLAWFCWMDWCTARTREASQLAGAGKAEPPKPEREAPGGERS